MPPTTTTTSSSTTAGASAASNPNKRNKSRLMALLGMQAMAAASYFLLASPSDSIDQHRSLMASPQSRSLMLHPSSGSSSSSSKDWITWPTVQNAFRKLCGVDERTASFSRSLSIAALDNIIPQYLKSSGDKRFHRFLACNV